MRVQVETTERRVMLHALGGNNPEAKIGYRNRYMTLGDNEICEGLINKGLMAKEAYDPANGGLVRYYVTDAGKQEVGCPLEETGPC